MLWLLLFLGLFILCAGMGVVFSVYLCLLWYATIRRAMLVQESEKPPRAKGLSMEDLCRLPGAGDGGAVAGTECAVCLDDIESGQAARVLPSCGHAFHLGCADAWLVNRPACPLCRAILVVPPPPPQVSQVAAVPSVADAV